MVRREGLSWRLVKVIASGGGDGGDRDPGQLGDDVGEPAALVGGQGLAEEDDVGAPGVGQLRVDPFLSNCFVVEVWPLRRGVGFQPGEDQLEVVEG